MPSLHSRQKGLQKREKKKPETNKIISHCSALIPVCRFAKKSWQHTTVQTVETIFTYFWVSPEQAWPSWRLKHHLSSRQQPQRWSSVRSELTVSSPVCSPHAQVVTLKSCTDLLLEKENPSLCFPRVWQQNRTFTLAVFSPCCEKIKPKNVFLCTHLGIIYRCFYTSGSCYSVKPSEQ